MVMLAPRSKIGPKERALREARETPAERNRVCKIDHQAEGAIPVALCAVCSGSERSPTIVPKKKGDDAPLASTQVAERAAPEADPAKSKKERKMRIKLAPRKEAKRTARNKARGEQKDGARPGSKLALIVDLLKRKTGTTTKEVLEKTGWPSVSMPQQATAAGIKLRKEKIDGVTRYYAA